MQEETQSPQDEHSNWEIEAIDVRLPEPARVTYPIDSNTDAPRSPNHVCRVSSMVVGSPVGRKEAIGWDPPRDRTHRALTATASPELSHRLCRATAVGTIAWASARSSPLRGPDIERHIPSLPGDGPNTVVAR